MGDPVESFLATQNCVVNSQSADVRKMSGHAPMARCSSGIRTIDASSQSVPGRCVHKMSKNAVTARSSVVIQRTIVSSTSVQNSCAPPMLETVESVDLFLGIRIFVATSQHVHVQRI